MIPFALLAGAAMGVAAYRVVTTYLILYAFAKPARRHAALAFRVSIWLLN